MFLISALGISAFTATSCGNKVSSAGNNGDFKYIVDEFADIQVLRYRVPEWDSLTFNHKAYIYHLGEAAKSGRDILFDQNCSYNLAVRRVLEKILAEYKGDTSTKEYQDFLIYAKRVFFSNGIHHHYALDKIIPECPQEYFRSLMTATGQQELCDELLPVIFDPAILSQRSYQGKDKDIVMASAVNFYDGNITKDEANAFYQAMAKPGDTTPPSYGLNSKLVKRDGKIEEEVYKIGGKYDKTLKVIVGHLNNAKEFAENDAQRNYIEKLIEYYTTGDLKTWDEYNIAWVQETEGSVDFINGFVEDYNDPLGRKGAWEGNVSYKDFEASNRTKAISDNAQWFEDHSPVDARFKKSECKGISAKVIDAVMLGGDCHPATPIGINLPNADWIRRDHGSKSVTIANITHAYDLAAQESPKSTLSEFAYDEEEIATAKKYLAITDEIHTDLHECLGNGSGQLLPGTSPNALGEFSSTLEETRADLFGLYYMADQKLVDLGIIPDLEAYKAMYANYIRNGLMVQFSRVELGKKNTEAHMQNRKLIAQWCYEKGLAENVIEKKEKDGKTYFVVNDYPALRGLFGELLAEVQRIKSEGDYEAGKALVNNYAVEIDYDLHKEVLERYAALNLKPYGGFVNPIIEPVVKNGVVVDYRISYTDDFLGQMLEYGREYRTL